MRSLLRRRATPEAATDAQLDYLSSLIAGYRRDRPDAIETRPRTEIASALEVAGIDLRGDLQRASLPQIGEAVSAALYGARLSKDEASAMIGRLTAQN